MAAVSQRVDVLTVLSNAKVKTVAAVICHCLNDSDLFTSVHDLMEFHLRQNGLERDLSDPGRNRDRPDSGNRPRVTHGARCRGGDRGSDLGLEVDPSMADAIGQGRGKRGQDPAHEQGDQAHLAMLTRARGCARGPVGRLWILR